MAKDNVYHVRFPDPVGGDYDHYFSSVKAIFDKFTEDQIGASARALWAYGVAKGRPFRGELCIISKGQVNRRRQSKKEAQDGK